MRRRTPPYAAVRRLHAPALLLCLALLGQTPLAASCAKSAGTVAPTPSVAAAPVAKTPADPVAKAEALLADGPEQDPEAALSLLADNTDAAARLARTEALRLLGRQNEAVAEANRLILEDARLPEAFVARARVLYDAGAGDRALEDCGAALRLDPKNLDALLTQGDIFFSMALAVPAELSYTHAIETWPNEALPYINRGVVRDDQGRYGEAIADFDRAIALDPSSAAAYANRGVSRSQTGNTAGMCADYARACALGQCSRLEDAKKLGYCAQTGGK